MALSDKERESFPSRGDDRVRSNTKHHNKCVKRLEYSMRRSKSVLYTIVDKNMYDTLRMDISPCICRCVCKIHVGSYGEGWLVRSDGCTDTCN